MVFVNGSAARWWAPVCFLFMTVTVLPVLGAQPQTPEEMYAYAVRQLDRGYYEKAVSVFEQIKTRYPFSKYAVLSELRIGDAHFKRGEYLEAVDAYRYFIKLHPKHPEIDYVVYRIGLSQFKDAPKWVQRDQTSTRQMLATIAHFEERFPDSEYIDEVQAMRTEGRTRLARGVFAIGRFYYKRGRYNTRGDARKAAYAAAIGRFEQVLDEYPDITGVAESALYHEGLIYLATDDADRAGETLERLKARFPDAASAIATLEDKLARAETQPRTARPVEPESPEDVPQDAPGTAPPGPAAGAEETRAVEDTGDVPPPPPPPRVQDDDFMPSLESGPSPERPTGDEASEPPPPPPPPAARDDDFMPVLEPSPPPTPDAAPESP